METSLTQPFTNVQRELLSVFSHELSESDIVELRKTLTKFFAEKLIRHADATWEKEHWTDETVEQMLQTKMRIPTR